MKVVDPLEFLATLWPDVTLYDKQREVLYSVWENDATFVPAGNMLGKDYIGALVCLMFFLSRHPCRIVTTSAKEQHLMVLWGEMNQFIQTCSVKLPLVINHQHIRKVVRGKVCPLSYITGMVAGPDSIAAMGGHHIAQTGDGIPRTMFMVDEASSVPSEYYETADPWANRAFVIGNTYPCTNFWYEAIEGKADGSDKGGDILREKGNRKAGYYRKVIPIVAEDSPNVKLALIQISRGLKPTGEMIIPGVKPWQEYQKNLAMWDEREKCIKLHAKFYKGSEVMLYPSAWMTRAHEISHSLALSGKKRTALSIGIDTGQGTANTVWTATDLWGIIEQKSMKTPDTSVIVGETLAFALKWNCPLENVLFDAGGGGLEHADRLRMKGHMVRTVMFGEAATPVDKFKRTHNYRGTQSKIEDAENRYIYKNRRAEMYGILRLLLDPTNEGFGIPREYGELNRQLAKFPYWLDDEGRMYLPPKNRKPDAEQNVKRKVTLTELLGHSPDESDSLMLAVFGMMNKQTQVTAGAVG